MAYFGRDEGTFDRYLAARDDFEARFPDWPVWFEHLLINHMFFVQFPFQDRPESIGEEFVALCAVYALLRFLALGTRPGGIKPPSSTLRPPFSGSSITLVLTAMPGICFAVPAAERPTPWPI